MKVTFNVVEGIEPLEEEDVRKFWVLGKDLTWRVIYNTSRCKDTWYDHETKKLKEWGEPLRTLTKLRYLEKVGAIFGIFAQPDREWEIEIGDIIKYTRKTPTPTKYT